MLTLPCFSTDRHRHHSSAVPRETVCSALVGHSLLLIRQEGIPAIRRNNRKAYRRQEEVRLSQDNADLDRSIALAFDFLRSDCGDPCTTSLEAEHLGSSVVLLLQIAERGKIRNASVATTTERSLQGFALVYQKDNLFGFLRHLVL
jgi:hypothetical protein